MAYFRPIPSETGARLAGGWTRFDRAERLDRNTAPQIIPLAEVPPEWRAAWAAPRPDFAGIAMDRPALMGVLNVTPDSFSDGGQWAAAEAAVTQGRAMRAAGAAVIDVGGESTRPGAAEVPADEETARILPVIRALASEGATLSADTRKAEVAGPALAAGARIVNDVSGLDFDPSLAGLVARAGAALILMHAQGVPATMQDNPSYGDVLLDVYDALAQRIARAEAAGIPRARLMADPGIGFGKTQAHNLALLRRISIFHGLGVPILLGVSRKAFIGAIGGASPASARDPGTQALTLAATAQGVQMHRVHDVAGAAQALALWQAVQQD